MSSVLKGGSVWSRIYTDAAFHDLTAPMAAFGEVETVHVPTPEERAEAIISDAQARAAEIVVEAQRRAAQLESHAQREGLERGRSEGRCEWRAAMDELEREQSRLNEQFAAMLEDAEPELMRLSVEIARRVIKREIEQDPNTVLSVLRDVLRRVREREIRISVSPEDLECVLGARDEIARLSDAGDGAEVVADETIARGGCVVTSPTATLDATIDTQLARFESLIPDGSQSDGRL